MLERKAVTKLNPNLELAPAYNLSNQRRLLRECRPTLQARAVAIGGKAGAFTSSLARAALDTHTSAHQLSIFLTFSRRYYLLLISSCFYALQSELPHIERGGCGSILRPAASPHILSFHHSTRPLAQVKPDRPFCRGIYCCYYKNMLTWPHR